MKIIVPIALAAIATYLARPSIKVPVHTGDGAVLEDDSYTYTSEDFQFLKDGSSNEFASRDAILCANLIANGLLYHKIKSAIPSDGPLTFRIPMDNTDLPELWPPMDPILIGDGGGGPPPPPPRIVPFNYHNLALILATSDNGNIPDTEGYVVHDFGSFGPKVVSVHVAGQPTSLQTIIQTNTSLSYKSSIDKLISQFVYLFNFRINGVRFSKYLEYDYDLAKGFASQSIMREEGSFLYTLMREESLRPLVSLLDKQHFVLAFNKGRNIYTLGMANRFSFTGPIIKEEVLVPLAVFGKNGVGIIPSSDITV